MVLEFIEKGKLMYEYVLPPCFYSRATLYTHPWQMLISSLGDMLLKSNSFGGIIICSTFYEHGGIGISFNLDELV